MKKLSDEELVKLYKEGKEEAFEVILERYKGPLYTFLIKMVRNPAVAEDLFQEAFIKVIKALADYKSNNKFKSWIYRITNNVAIDYLRKKKRRKITSIEEKIVKKKDNYLRLEDMLKSKNETPDKVLEKKEFKKALINCLEELTSEQKEVFLLKHQGGFSFKEIAEMLNCPLNTALGRMHQGIKKIRRKLVMEK